MSGRIALTHATSTNTSQNTTIWTNTTGTTLDSATGGLDEGNRIAGTFELAQETVSTLVDSWTASQVATGSGGQYTTVSTTIFESSGDRSIGEFESTAIHSWSLTTTAATGGSDARAAYTSTSTGSGESTTIHTGNTITGDDTLDITSESTVTNTRENVGGDTNYEQTVVSVNTASSYSEVNRVTGVFASNAASYSSITFDEAGDYLGKVFSLHSEDTADSTLESSGNHITGEYTHTSTLDTTSSLLATGDDGTNYYELNKTSYLNLDSTTEGNAITGGYSTTGTSVEGSTAIEENTYGTAGTASFTEILFESFSFTVTGNAIDGDYERDDTSGIRTSSLEATTTFGTDSYTVIQTVTGIFTRSDDGNSVTGDFLTIDLATDAYEVEQVGTGTNNFTFTMTGTHDYTDTEEGNTLTGEYERTKTGTDEYEITMTGTKSGGSYAQSITGDDEYTLTDEGNLATGHYERTITGTGTYNRTTTGAGATLPTDTGTYSFQLGTRRRSPQRRLRHHPSRHGPLRAAGGLLRHLEYQHGAGNGAYECESGRRDLHICTKSCAAPLYSAVEVSDAVGC